MIRGLVANKNKFIFNINKRPINDIIDSLNLIVRFNDFLFMENNNIRFLSGVLHSRVVWEKLQKFKSILAHFAPFVFRGSIERATMNHTPFYLYIEFFKKDYEAFKKHFAKTDLYEILGARNYFDIYKDTYILRFIDDVYETEEFEDIENLKIDIISSIHILLDKIVTKTINDKSFFEHMFDKNYKMNLLYKTKDKDIDIMRNSIYESFKYSAEIMHKMFEKLKKEDVIKLIDYNKLAKEIQEELEDYRLDDTSEIVKSLRNVLMFYKRSLFFIQFSFEVNYNFYLYLNDSYSNNKNKHKNNLKYLSNYEDDEEEEKEEEEVEDYDYEDIFGECIKRIWLVDDCHKKDNNEQNDEPEEPPIPESKTALYILVTFCVDYKNKKAFLSVVNKSTKSEKIIEAKIS